MARVIMTVKGSDGHVELTEDRIIIQRDGLFNSFKYGKHARKEIPLMSITSINFREASFFKPGAIDIDYSGRSSNQQHLSAVAFMKKSEPEFVRFKEKLFEQITKVRK